MPSAPLSVSFPQGPPACTHHCSAVDGGCRVDVHIPCNTRQWIQGRQLTGVPAPQIREVPLVGATVSLGSPKCIGVSEQYLG